MDIHEIQGFQILPRRQFASSLLQLFVRKHYLSTWRKQMCTALTSPPTGIWYSIFSSESGRSTMWVGFSWVNPRGSCISTVFGHLSRSGEWKVWAAHCHIAYTQLLAKIRCWLHKNTNMCVHMKEICKDYRRQGICQKGSIPGWARETYSRRHSSTDRALPIDV